VDANRRAVAHGAAFLGQTVYAEPDFRGGPFVMVFVLLFGGILLQIPGFAFRARMDRGPWLRRLSLIPALLRECRRRLFPVVPRRLRPDRIAVDADSPGSPPG
jgi:hypothetical protein